MAQGHSGARHYPVPMLWTEARIARRRVKRDRAEEAILTQMAVTSVISAKAGRAFKDRIAEMTKD